MIRQAIHHADADVDSHEAPTLWGLSPIALHDRFWAARGVQVVRQGEHHNGQNGANGAGNGASNGANNGAANGNGNGEHIALDPHAELYLLTDDRTLTIFRLGKLVDTLAWLRPRILFIRLHSTLERGYREQVLTDEDDRFLGFKRIYGDADARVARVAITPHRAIAERWRQTQDPRIGWRTMRQAVERDQRTAVSVEGHVFDARFEPDVKQFIRQLVQVWKRPDATISRVRRFGEHVWGDAGAVAGATVSERTHFIGPVWIGAGRSLGQIESVVGPAVLWDNPEARPDADALRWDRIKPTEVLRRAPDGPRLNRMQRAGKRAFDIACAFAGLLVSLPLYPLIMLAIWLEDGRPFFFGHRRETIGGHEFLCLKFRSMRKDAERVKANLAAQNKADGPQFYIQNDPRLTRVGRFLRDTNLDELPQFINVLLGHMSMVGPRPSPRDENQYCPPWREARLSVRPGITGLWQVMRSRAAGLDFQEWIRYDIEYVENLSWRLDLWILWRTVAQIIGIKR